MESTREATYAEIACRLRNIPLDNPCSSYEWEELVEKLCISEDDELRIIGKLELDSMQQKSCRK